MCGLSPRGTFCTEPASSSSARIISAAVDVWASAASSSRPRCFSARASWERCNLSSSSAWLAATASSSRSEVCARSPRIATICAFFLRRH